MFKKRKVHKIKSELATRLKSAKDSRVTKSHEIAQLDSEMYDMLIRIAPVPVSETRKWREYNNEYRDKMGDFKRAEGEESTWYDISAILKKIKAMIDMLVALGREDVVVKNAPIQVIKAAFSGEKVDSKGLKKMEAELRKAYENITNQRITDEEEQRQDDIARAVWQERIDSASGSDVTELQRKAQEAFLQQQKIASSTEATPSPITEDDRNKKPN